ncbi:MAG: hypothetical protein Q7R45_09655, partial [Sulfuricaulis sp.]|nr:hypothetical protein [Sulfuricaulis sp.]
MDKDLIASALEKLKLLNLVLHEARFIRSKEHDPLSYPTDIQQDSKLSVRTEELTYASKAGDKGDFNVFRVYVDIGVRAVKEEPNQSSSELPKSLACYYEV